jgi:hypothetical protein
MRIAVAVLACLFFTGSSGCDAARFAPLNVDSGNRQLVAHQFIIKFKVNTLTCDLAGIARLAADTGTAIEYVRSMSGGACVIRQSLSGDTSSLEQLTIFKHHPAVEWVEQDRVMKTL